MVEIGRMDSISDRYCGRRLRAQDRQRCRGWARLVAAVLLGFATAALWAGTSSAEKRLALVIGNAAYENLQPLANPINDADGVAAALEELGFEVMLGTDLDREAMLNLIDRYVRAAREADVSMFFYAGHGFQAQSENFLVPVNAALTRPADVPAATVKLAEITAALSGAPGIHLVFLDACRDNPLNHVENGEAGPHKDGLAQVGDAAGFLFAFATQPNNVAWDGKGRNSYFSQALLGHIATPGQDVADMMIAVRNDVLKATGGLQVPWENSSLTRQFQFAPGPAQPSPETLLWQVAAAAGDPLLMDIYLKRYPDGAHAAEVQSILSRETGGDSDAGAVRSLPEEARLPEQAFWDVAKRTRERPLVEIYLRRYPDGVYREEAARLLKVLPRPEEEVDSLRCERLATHPRDATANLPGVPVAVLMKHAGAAIEACTAAAEAYPEEPRYTALLARVLHVVGRRDEAIDLYHHAAELGDVRAMWSLGLIYETGDGVPRDPRAAADHYMKAAAGGSLDGLINLAVAYIQGRGVPRDLERGITLTEEAAVKGSAPANYNLGVLAREGSRGAPEDAVDHFLRAAELGEPRGYLAAAILLDEGDGVERDPKAAAEMLLRSVASDHGEAHRHLVDNPEAWHTETIAAVQQELKRVGLYDGAVDGLSGPLLAAALQDWRRGGALRLVIEDRTY